MMVMSLKMMMMTTPILVCLSFFVGLVCNLATIATLRILFSFLLCHPCGPCFVCGGDGVGKTKGRKCEIVYY